MDIISVRLEKEEENVILGQSHFIKSVEDIYESIESASPSAKFGLAFCEASGKRLIRFDGNDKLLTERAIRNAMKIGAGHSFIIHLKDAFPINVLPHIRNVPEILNIYAATSNDLSVIVAEDSGRRGIIGVIDGEGPLGVEGEDDIRERQEFLRKIGYKR
jgi:adenosine/AMP kinase